MKRIAGLQRRGEHSLRRYTLQVVKTPLQALVLVAAVGAAVLTLSVLFPLVVVLGVEVVLIAALPRCEWFRRSVDRELALVERTRAIELRASLLMRMSDEHRRELDMLERLAAKVKEQSGDTDDGESSSSGDWTGLDRLLAAYVQLATASRASMESCRAAERCGLERQIATLETLSMSATDSTRMWIERRLGIARQRLSTAARLRDDCESLAHGLAMVADLVRWTYDESVASRAELLRDQVEDALAACERSGPAVRELAALCAELEPVDPRLLALGRPAVPALVAEPDPRNTTLRVAPIEMANAAPPPQPAFAEIPASCLNAVVR